ncbi:DIS3-like exonuclease 1 [Pelomyxa schiedti]|nr:DIS3-like exonuclease 1 [Pelomyxa schiedti]
MKGGSDAAQDATARPVKFVWKQRVGGGGGGSPATGASSPKKQPQPAKPATPATPSPAPQKQLHPKPPQQLQPQQQQQHTTSGSSPSPSLPPTPPTAASSSAASRSAAVAASCTVSVSAASPKGGVVVVVGGGGGGGVGSGGSSAATKGGVGVGVTVGRASDREQQESCQDPQVGGGQVALGAKASAPLQEAATVVVTPPVVALPPKRGGDKEPTGAAADAQPPQQKHGKGSRKKPQGRDVSSLQPQQQQQQQQQQTQPQLQQPVVVAESQQQGLEKIAPEAPSQKLSSGKSARHPANYSVKLVGQSLHFRLNRATRISVVMKEHYIRTDILCGMMSCKKCVGMQNQHQPDIVRSMLVDENQLLFGSVKRRPCDSCNVAVDLASHSYQTLVLSPAATHYPVFDTSIVTKYLDLLENDSVSDFILLQSVLAQAREQMTRHSYNRLRSLLKQPAKRCFFFSNEHMDGAYAKNSTSNKHCQAVVQAVSWYSKHLTTGVPVVLVSDDLGTLATGSASLRPPSKAMTCTEYIKSFYMGNQSVLMLHESIQLSQQSVEHTGTTGPSLRHQSSVYTPYISDCEREKAVQRGSLIVGKIRLSGKNINEATLQSYGAGVEEVLVIGRENMNRAIHGDVVAVQILPKSEWVSPSNIVNLPDDTESFVASGRGGKTSKPCGKVVSIVKRNWRQVVATLPESDANQCASQGTSSILVVPFDYRFPKIRIHTKQADKISDCRIIVSIDNWESDSQYPNGHFVKNLGPIGKLEAEMASVLFENGITCPTFTSAALATLPTNTPQCPWKIPKVEYTTRRDLRTSARVFSIDPIGCRDVDDALSMEIVEDKGVTITRIGVHIADVSYFVREGSLIDKEAKLRSTTVYLPHTRFNMIPSVLSEEIASLHGGVDRLAMSVIWDFTPQMEIVNTWFGQTVINNGHELNYELAQEVIDGSLSNKDREKIKHYAQLQTDLLACRAIARKLRADRLANGALELESDEVSFEIDPQTKHVIKLVPHGDLEVHHVVEEFMLLANEYVADQIYKSFPSCALLRHHPSPPATRFQSVVQCAQAIGHTIDVSSNKALAISLEVATHGNAIISNVLRSMATRAMEEAQYICSGCFAYKDFYHYGLATPIYTHFTSPIRRYADIVVHRLLLQSLSKSNAVPITSPALPESITHVTVPSVDGQQLQQMADHMNEQHNNSRRAQKDATKIFQIMYFKEKPQTADAYIYTMKQNGLLVHIPRFSLKGIVYLRDSEGKLLLSSATALCNRKFVPVQDYSVDLDNHLLTLVTGIGQVQLKLFTCITVLIGVLPCRSHRPELKLEVTHFGSMSTVEGQGQNTRIKTKDIVSTVTQANVQHEENASEFHPTASLCSSLYTKLTSPQATIPLKAASRVKLPTRRKVPKSSLKGAASADQSIRRWALTPAQIATLAMSSGARQTTSFFGPGGSMMTTASSDTQPDLPNSEDDDEAGAGEDTPSEGGIVGDTDYIQQPQPPQTKKTPQQAATSHKPKAAAATATSQQQSIADILASAQRLEPGYRVNNSSSGSQYNDAVSRAMGSMQANQAAKSTLMRKERMIAEKRKGNKKT